MLFFKLTGGEEDFGETGVANGSVEVGVVVGLIACSDEDEAGSLVVVTRADDRAPHFWVSCKGVVEVYGDEEHKKGVSHHIVSKLLGLWRFRNLVGQSITSL